MSNSHFLAEDAASREEALALDSFIVEAPAGAGKTELLTQRYLKLLQTVDAPEEIIAITFTNKAASEMKSRIMDSLQMAASGELPARAHKQKTFELGQQALHRSAQLGWSLLDTSSRLRIYTIDSLSSNLARQMPLLSRFGAQPGVRDDASVFYQDAASRTLQNLDHPELGAIVERALRYFDNDTYRLELLLAEMLAKRDQWLNYTQNSFTAEDAEAALAHMVEQDIKAATAFLTPSLQQSLMPIARYAACNVDADNSILALQDWDAPLTADVSDLGLWQSLADLLLTGTGGLRKRLDKGMGLQAIDEAKPYKEALTAILDSLRDIPGVEAAIARLRLLPQAHDDDAWQMIATLGLLLNTAVAELWLVFQAHGEVDFVEISQRSLQALEDDMGNPTDLALKLDYRVQHLLVDEFQDTSPTQIKLIRALTQGWMPGDGRTLFAVGDPMQSIYRFRKANVGLFLRVAQEGIGHVPLKSLKLWRNNRSCPEVVNWVNHAFVKVFPDADSISRGAIKYRPFVATRQAEMGEGVFVHALLDGQLESDFDAEETDEEIASDVRQLEASQIIKIIQETRAIDAEKKIAVLVRARSHLHALVTEIRRNHPHLSFQAVEIEELANRQIVQDLLSLTNALHQRADRVHWLAILRAPWCGLTLADLHALVSGDKYSTLMQLMHDESRLQLMSADGRQRLLHVRSVMDEALMSQGRQSTSRWVHGVWLMLGGADCLWDAGDVRDVQAFFERIEQLEAIGQFSTELLAKEVQKLYAAPDAKADDKLQFMTIHKSKGLEFDTVILPGLDRKTGGNEQPLLLWEEVAAEDSHDAAEASLVAAPFIPKGRNKSKQATPYDYLKLLEKERAEYEDARVLYVAATRAERCLHLLGAAKLDSKSGEAKAPKNTFLAMLWPVINAEFSPEKLLKDTKQQLQARAIPLAEFVPQLVRLNAPTIPAQLSQRQLHVESQARNQVEPSFKEDSSLNLEADIGTLTHKYLELMAKQGLAQWSVERIAGLLPIAESWFLQRTYDAAKASSATVAVTNLLNKVMLSETARWVLQARPDAQSELVFDVVIDGEVKKRVIDRTFTESGERWVIDYKTTTLPDTADVNASAEQYREQLESYASLFADDGLPISMAIYFVSIDKLVKL